MVVVLITIGGVDKVSESPLSGLKIVPEGIRFELVEEIFLSGGNSSLKTE
jgi:hypothetical protein